MAVDVDALLRGVFTDPADSLRKAQAARGGEDSVLGSQLLRVMGNAHRELREMDRSLRCLEEAVAIAERLGDDRLAGLAEMSLAATHTYVGGFEEALRLCDNSVRRLSGDERIEAMAQRAGVLQRASRPREALLAFGEAFEAVRESTDRTLVGDLYMNRGVLLGLEGDVSAAESDTTAAYEVFATEGWSKRAADMWHNLGWLAGRRGDIVEALRYFEEASAMYDAAGVPALSVFPDRCEVLISAGLVAEAQERARFAAEALGEAGNRIDQAEALLLSARAGLASTDPTAVENARQDASAARQHFSDSGRTGWEAVAAHLEARAALASRRVDELDRSSILAAATVMDESGLAVAASEAAVTAAEVSLLQGDLRTCAADLADLTAKPLGVNSRSRVEFLRAELLRRSGDDAGALDVCRAALRDFIGWGETLAGLELRAHVMRHATSIAETAVELARAQGSIDTLLEVVELQRAFALAPAPIRPPADPVLDADLAELRDAVRRREEEIDTGVLSPETDTAVTALRARVRDRSRSLVGRARPADADVGTTPDDVGPSLAYINSGGSIDLVVDNGRTREMVEVGSVESVGAVVSRAQTMLRLHLSAVARGDYGGVGRLQSAVAELEDVLLPSALSRLLTPAPASITLLPVPMLYDVPWGLFESLLDSVFAVAPSFAVLKRCLARPATAETAVAVSGPLLTVADSEAASVAQQYQSAQAFVTADLGADDVKAAVASADVAHFACHGHFARGNPMFSSLDTHAGRLFMHELERLQPCPSTVVLSACHAGAHSSPSPQEILGLTAAFLAAGSRSVVASSVAVPDLPDVEHLMVELHRRLAAGATPSEALRALRSLDPILGGSFVCHGAG